MEQLLALEMIRVTEAAAIDSARFMGRGERDAADAAGPEAKRRGMDEIEFRGRGERDGADAAATEAKRRAMDEIEFRGRIVIGEGERDEAPMLYIGERVGRDLSDTEEPRVRIPVDPLQA